MTDEKDPATPATPAAPLPTSTATSAEVAGLTAKVATIYDGFTVVMMADMSKVIPNVATAINNLNLKQGDVLICFVGRAS